MEKGRVLHMVTAPVLGGAQKIALELAREQRAEGWRVFFATSPGGPLWSKLQGFETLAVPLERGLSLGGLFALRKFLGRQKIQILHAHGARAALLGALAVWGGPARLFIHVHLADAWRWSGSWRARLDRLVSRRAARVIACSEGLRRDLVARQGLAPESTIAILNGIDLGLYSKATRGGRGEPGSFVVGVCARLEPQKGLRFLIEAMALLLPRWPGLRLVVAGEGALRPELEALARERGVPADWLGHREDVAALLGSFDVFALPSLVEGLPLALLEAMAVGVPVVATRIPGSVELIEHGETGLLVPPEEAAGLAGALELLLSSPGLGERLAERALGFVRSRHGLEAMGEKVRGLYEESLAQAPTRS